MLPFHPEKEFFYIAGPKEDIHAFFKAFHADPTAFYSREDKYGHNSEIDLQLGFFQKGNYACVSCDTYTPASHLAVTNVAEQFPRCEIIRHRGYDRVCGANIFDYKLLNTEEVRLYDGYNPGTVCGRHAIHPNVPNNIAHWGNLFLFGQITYTLITLQLRNGKVLEYIGDEKWLSKEIAAFKRSPQDVAQLAELCSLAAPERSVNKWKNDVLKAVKSPDLLQEVSFTTFRRRKKLWLDERALLADPSVQAFSHTWVEEIEEDILDYDTARCTQKRLIQLQAVEPTPEGEYQENLYILKDKTTKKKLTL